MPTTTEIPEPIPKRSDERKVVRQVALKHLAHEGMMLEKIMRQNRKAEKMAEMAAKGEIGTLELTPEEEQEMAVNIGNETHYHIVQPEAAATPAPATPAEKPDVIQPTIVKPDIVNPVFAPVGSNGGSKLLPIIAVILGTLGAGGIGAGALALWERWTNKPTVNIAAPLPPPLQPSTSQDLTFGISVSDRP